MDSNNPTSQTPINPQPVGAVQSAQPPAYQPQPPISQPTSGGESNKMVLMLVIGLVVIALLAGGVYFFFGKQSQTSQPAQQAPVTSNTPLPEENLESNLESIDVETASDAGEFNAVDTDIEQL